MTRTPSETVIENVYICKADGAVVIDKEEQPCPTCNNSMEKTGWFESPTPKEAEAAR